MRRHPGIPRDDLPSDHQQRRLFEWHGSAHNMRRYYDAGGQRAAMRWGTNLSFVFCAAWAGVEGLAQAAQNTLLTFLYTNQQAKRPGQQRTEIDPIHHPVDHPHQVSLRDQFIQAGWQQHRLLHRVRLEGDFLVSYFHAPIESHFPHFAKTFL